MADQKQGSYPGHDEGTEKAKNAPAGYNSPSVHAPLSETPVSVNVKTPTGHTGGESRK